MAIERPFGVPAGGAAKSDVVHGPDVVVERAGAMVFRVFCDGREIGSRTVPVALAELDGSGG